MAIETAPETIQAPEKPIEPQEATDGLEEAPEPAETEPEVLVEPEHVSRLGDPRRAVVDIIGKRLERMLQPVDIAPEWTGVLVITRKDLGEALLAPLPPASIFSAAVQTPAFIYVDAVCPVCGIAGEILLEVDAKLTAVRGGRKLQLAAKAAAQPHICGQQRLRDVTPTRPVKGQTALDLGDEGEDAEVFPWDVQADAGEPAKLGRVDLTPLIQTALDETAKRLDAGERGFQVIDELRGAAANDVAEAEESTDGADDDLLPDPVPARRSRRNGQQHPSAPLN